MARNPGSTTRSTATTPASGTDRHDDLRAAVDILGDRWVLLLVGALADGPRRFGDLAQDVRNVAPNVLTDRLRRAERAGLLFGTAYQHRPRRLVYELTAAGHEVASILPALSAWSARRRGQAPPRHAACGTPLEMRWWCPECGVTDDIDHAAHADDVWL
jgi:DNA-binding HxlR family transcriptional regulator